MPSPTKRITFFARRRFGSSALPSVMKALPASYQSDTDSGPLTTGSAASAADIETKPKAAAAAAASVLFLNMGNSR